MKVARCEIGNMGKVAGGKIAGDMKNVEGNKKK